MCVCMCVYVCLCARMCECACMCACMCVYVCVSAYIDSFLSFVYRFLSPSYVTDCKYIFPSSSLPHLNLFPYINGFMPFFPSLWNTLQYFLAQLSALWHCLSFVFSFSFSYSVIANRTSQTKYCHHCLLGALASPIWHLETFFLFTPNFLFLSPFDYSLPPAICHILELSFHFHSRYLASIRGCKFYLYSIRVFTPVLASDYVFLKSEWQQVSSGLQDSSKYSSW